MRDVPRRDFRAGVRRFHKSSTPPQEECEEQLELTVALPLTEALMLAAALTDAVAAVLAQAMSLPPSLFEVLAATSQAPAFWLLECRARRRYGDERSAQSRAPQSTRLGP